MQNLLHFHSNISLVEVESCELPDVGKHETLTWGFLYIKCIVEKLSDVLQSFLYFLQMVFQE